MEEPKHFFTGVSEIWIDEERIMHVRFFKGITLTLPDMEEAYALFRELGIGPGKRKSRQLLTGGPFLISKEARQYAGRNGTAYFHAAALVNDSFLMRTVFNLFNALQKHNVPFRMFANETEAMDWLRTFPGE